MPCGSTAPVPVASLVVGRPNSITPPSPASTASLATFFKVSRVCWNTPGMLEISRGSVASSATNSGSTSWLGRTARLGDETAQRGRTTQPAWPDRGVAHAASS